MNPSRPPRVSIAIPVYNAADSIGESLASALGQTYEDLEVVIVDNASTDETVEVIRSFDDERIRLLSNPTNVGFHANTLRSIELSHGAYVKFLHADDVLFPTCVERMVEVMDRSERVGMVFARRRIELEDEQDPGQIQFRREHGDLYHRFGGLDEINDGRALLSRWMADGFRENWVGEPSSVMMRRTALEALGSFNPRIKMLVDVEMWARAMGRFDVGYVDEVLAAYRFHVGNLTATQGAQARWLDILWLLEGLREDARIPGAFPGLDVARAAERRKVARVLARTALRDRDLLLPRMRDLAAYAQYIAQRRVGRARPLHTPLTLSSAVR